MGESTLAASTFMARAIEEARRGLGRTHPNPAVGAVVVRLGRVIGRGYHRRAGMPHAEVEAIRDAGEDAAGSDLYVTLSPCNHFGRTPPCTDAILKAGIRRVFIGSIDPNPIVSGQGIEKLRAAGVEVYPGILKEECDQIIRPFAKHISTGRPFVVLKAAATLDGKLATRTGDSKWVSGPEARRLVHIWRDEFDAVLIGAQTLRVDDPLLTTRLAGPVTGGRLPRTPTRIVLAGDGPIPSTARLFDTTPGPVLLAVPAHRARELSVAGVEVLPLPSTQGRIELEALLDTLGQRGLTSVLVEGGALIHGAFLKAGLADEVRLFLAPRIAGGDGLSWAGPLGTNEMQNTLRLDGLSVEQVGEDILVVGRPQTPTS